MNIRQLKEKEVTMNALNGFANRTKKAVKHLKKENAPNLVVETLVDQIEIAKRLAGELKNEISEDIKERALQRINYGDITEVKFVPEK
ncbi:hypothetical protein P7D15_01805 [Bacillus cereus]|uniref:hypothetical protein n=1 Tax=Bacillus cereus group TaxID=86661 RepID=UPI001F55F455|nr:MULTISPECIES: hypothetical protein [Bacillus cereus group]MDF9599151.1 hypothetical protein [Bacillus cereus]MDG1589484.1 hypothetical protein [Bacillus cereus]